MVAQEMIRLENVRRCRAGQGLEQLLAVEEDQQLVLRARKGHLLRRTLAEGLLAQVGDTLTELCKGQRLQSARGRGRYRGVVENERAGRLGAEVAQQTERVIGWEAGLASERAA